MKFSAMIPLILFLVAATLLLGLFNPSFAIFPVFLLFILGVGFFFQPRWKRRPRPKPLPRDRDIAGPYSARAHSRLTLLDEVPRGKTATDNHPSRRDEDIGAEVRSLLAADPTLRSAGIEAESRFGRVTLVGFVRDEIDRSRAHHIAQGVPGVRDVSLQIRLQPQSRRDGTARVP